MLSIRCSLLDCTTDMGNHGFCNRAHTCHEIVNVTPTSINHPSPFWGSSHFAQVFLIVVHKPFVGRRNRPFRAKLAVRLRTKFTHQSFRKRKKMKRKNGLEHDRRSLPQSHRFAKNGPDAEVLVYSWFSDHRIGTSSETLLPRCVYVRKEYSFLFVG